MCATTDSLRAVSYFSTTLQSKISVDEVLWEITKNIIYRLGFSDCVIYLYDSERKVLIQKAAFGLKNPMANVIYNQLEVPLGMGIVGHVAKTKKPLIVHDTQNDSRYIIDDEERRSEISVPILIGDTLFGVIDSEHSDPGFFTEDHLHLLTIIASLCGQRIKDLRMNVKTQLTKDNEYYHELIRLFEEEKIYRDPNLSLECLAEKMGISAGYLSRLINDTTNASFSQFTNSYRVKETQKKLVSEEYSHYNILSIGLESGFNSKASFNRNFKEIAGMPPQDYLKKIKKTG
ncbi:MAG: GAF domain-containing protein [Balneola sp.]